MFKRKDIINNIITEYTTDPEAAVNYIDSIMTAKEYKYQYKRLSDLKTIIEMAIIVGQKQKDNK